MRIITGRAKGIRLQTLEGNDTRPTSERSKEAVFSMLQFEIEGRAVLDLFAGSGQLGLEAISRGARCAHLVDGGRAAIEIIKKNVAKCRFENEVSIHNEDALSFLKRQSGAQKYGIVFLDPPYASDLIDQALTLLYNKELIKDTSYIVCESDRFDILGLENSEKYDIIKHMKHGVAHISVLKLKK